MNGSVRMLRWRIVFAIQRLISLVFPPLHSIRWKLFVLYFTILIVPASFLAWSIRRNIETSYLHSTEEGMIDVAALVAELYTRLIAQYGEGSPRLHAELARSYANLDETYQIKARLFGYTKKEVDTRLIIYDAMGRLLFDTANAALPDTSYADRSDVRAALGGKYGARWELDRVHQRVNLYSTLPVFVRGKIVGVVSVSKPTNRIRNFITRSLKNVLLPAALALAVTAALVYLLSGYITRVVADLARRAERIAAGESGVRLETWTQSEFGVLARAVEKMRRRLEGKAYVEEMAANLSHELKTPLASIRGAAELLEDGAINDAIARRKFLGNIQTEVQRLDQIVGDLLKLSRIETQAIENEMGADCAAVARGVARIFGERARSCGMDFFFELPSEPLPTKIPELQLQQLLNNLLENALQFTPAGKCVRLSLKETGGNIELRVSDEGCGIETELLPKIFDRFFTTENPRTGARGSGLGLAIVKSIVTRHGGTIGVKSEHDHGTEFIARIPF